MPEDGPVGPSPRGSGLRYSNDVTPLVAFLAAVALVPAQPVTIAVVDTGANVRAPEIAARQPLTYDVRTRGRDVRDLNGHGGRGFRLPHPPRTERRSLRRSSRRRRRASGRRTPR